VDEENDDVGDETMDFVNMITNGYNDILDLGEKLQDMGTSSRNKLLLNENSSLS
jgi:hypothetical protein